MSDQINNNFKNMSPITELNFHTFFFLAVYLFKNVRCIIECMILDPKPDS